MLEIRKKLEFLYGKEQAEWCKEEIEKKILNFKNKQISVKKAGLDEKDSILITYGDQFKGRNKKPLQNLNHFTNKYLKDIISAIHILPFYPYTSDDGFSIVDYFKVNEELGTWEDIQEISKNFRIMFDLVCNHISSKSEWFLEYLKGNEEYKDFFIEVNGEVDLSSVTRPRALPLLTKFNSKDGIKNIWTTFSEDQIDLNFQNPKVLLRVIDVLLFYIEKGAQLIRLDAIGFIWKKIGTTCMNLDETHTIVQLIRSILDEVAPEVVVITETNVPHKENISYFGNGHNEANMVYQFPLPPLTLYSFINEDAEVLSKWADSLEKVSDETTFFNFLASHDGIGVNPARGFISEEEIGYLVKKIEERGGYVSYKNNPDGTRSPYELNISYFNAINDPSEDENIKIQKFANAYGISFVLMGVPGIYIHSILGSQNFNEGVEKTGRYRTINREKFDIDEIEKKLNDKESLNYKVYRKISELLKIRKNEKAFHPNADQKILFENEKIFSILRSTRDGKNKILALHNVTGQEQEFKINLEKINIKSNKVRNIINGKEISIQDNTLDIKLKAYEFVWMKF